MTTSHRYSKGQEPITADTGAITWAMGGGYWYANGTWAPVVSS